MGMGENELRVNPKEEVPKKIVVEIGPGGSPFFVSGGRKLTPNEFYLAVDWLKDEAETTKVFADFDAETAQMGNSNQRLAVIGDAKELPISTSSVDEIIMNNVLTDPKTRDFKRILLEAERILKDEGKIILNETLTPEAGLFKDFHTTIEFNRYLRENDLNLEVETLNYKKEELAKYVAEEQIGRQPLQFILRKIKK